MGAAGFSGSFAPIVQYEKWEIHPVFPHFPHFRLDQNLSPNLLAPLCGVALNKAKYHYSVMLLHDNTQNQSPISDEPSMLHYPYLLRFFRDSTSAPLPGGISSTRNGESVFSTGRSSFPRSVSFRIIRGASSARSGSLAVWTASLQPPQAAQSIPSAQSPPAGSPRRIHPQPSVRREAGY